MGDILSFDYELNSSDDNSLYGGGFAKKIQENWHSMNESNVHMSRDWIRIQILT